MKSIHRFGMGVIILLMIACPAYPAQDDNQRKEATAPETKSIRVWVFLKTGDLLTGYLVKADSNFVEIDGEGTPPRQIPTRDINHIRFGEGAAEKPGGPIRIPEIIEQPIERADVLPMSENLKPEIIYKEPAKYTQEAMDHGVKGIVVLNVIFNADGTISRIRIVRGLPYGLTERSIDAVKKIRFKPAIKDGQPVSVRGNLEYQFK
ncbi:MAG TPA: energy transducer TonB [Blastocatellia bacterium]|nr:energy transducer TonB [Blastocatellia bacterium]